MNQTSLKYNGLTGNQLKILALISMTCDHVGKELFPQVILLQIIGRLAFPIFAYMIAEGCKYTKNRKKYLLSMVTLAFVCQLVYYIAMGSLYQCVLVTFSLSILLIYAIDSALNKKTITACITAAIAFVMIFFISVSLPEILSHTDFAIDYGLWGILLPVFVYLANKKFAKLFGTAVALILLSYSLGGIQWFSLCTILFLALYNQKRGSMNLKNLFYIYYPLHLVVIYVISLFSN